MSEPDRLATIAAKHFDGLPIWCGNSIDPGILEAPDFRDWSKRETTPDQRRIENYLDSFPLSGKRILHVGIGNSSVARRFGGRARQIVGISIDAPEQELARSLGLANYRTVERNKYAGLGPDISGEFDFVLDNNISSICCCLTHLFALLEDYRDRLAPRGQILTDRQGLGWTPDVPPQNLRWRFTLEDLAFAAGLAGLQAEAIDDTLIVLWRGNRAMPTVLSRTSSVLRRAPRALWRRLKRLSLHWPGG